MGNHEQGYIDSSRNGPMIPLAKLPAAPKDALINVSAPADAVTISVCRLGATTALILVLAATMSCSSQGATATSGTLPMQVSTPSPEPPPERLIETFHPITGTPAAGRPTPSPVAVTAPPAPQGNLLWRLSSPDNGPFKAGEELSLTLELDPQNLAVSGIQFGLNYPREVLQLLEIVPGEILGPDPLIVEKSNQSQGQVLFAMARRGETVAPTGPGRVALITMRTLQSFPEDRNVMIWLDRVKLTGENFQTIGQDSVSWSLSGPG